MELRLEGRRALVTGASRGIGLAIARALAAEGARVVAGALHGSAELDALADVGFVPVDLSTREGPGTLVAHALDRLDGLDLLVNNVGGVHARLDGFVSVTDDDWDRTLTLNLLAAARTMRAALPALVQQPGAGIVTVSSVNAVLPDPAVIDYSAAKAALGNLCKALSKEYAGRVRVNTVSPGPVATDLWLGAGGMAETVAGSGDASAEEVAAQVAGQSASGRFTRPEEVADVVVFLASERAANITGSDVTIDGGLVSTLR